MSKVYFSKELDKVLDQTDFSKLGQKVAIKVHFGEKGCNTYLDPELVRNVYKRIEALGKEPTLVECNVLYKGSRTNSTDHIKTAKEHGFSDMEIDILDGEEGDEFLEVDGCKVGKGIEKYNSLVAVSHFKGHEAAGFGGSIKNLGMGLGSRAGKLDMHSAVQPIVSSGCTGCGACVNCCNTKAISIVEGKAVIDEELCEGCAMCIAVCPCGAMQIPWGGRSAGELQKRIAEYTAAIVGLFSDVFYINVLEKITKQCDCVGIEQEPFMEDVGILSSDDIVAIDQASLDLADRISEGKFKEINSVDNDRQIEELEKLGVGDKKYELVEL